MVEGEDGAAAAMAGCSVELRLVVPDPRFDLSKAVCSHGLFMMAPNRWLPAARSLLRPLRLASSPSTSLPVRISQPSPSAPLLIVSVYGAASLSADDQEAILGQVRRMLRISDENDRVIREFHQFHAGARDGGFGRVFRSPTLFEDMVKCILLCNCQWPRTLSMAKALCDLQLELKRDKTLGEVYPKTPPSREPERKRQKKTKVSLKLENKLTNREADLEDDVKSVHGQEKKCNETQDDNVSSNILLDGRETCDSDFSLGSSASKKVADNVLLQSDLFGDFPSPQELADVDVKCLANRCKLGYRAQRIISLAQDIVKHKIQYNRLKEICDGCTTSAYDDLDKELSCISGFGPFAKNYPKSFQDLLGKLEGDRALWEYPFAVAGVNITFMLIQMLELQAVKPRSIVGAIFLKLLCENEQAFDILYCLTFKLMDHQWLAMRATYMDFNTVMKSTRRELERELLLEDIQRIEDMPSYRLLSR